MPKVVKVSNSSFRTLVEEARRLGISVKDLVDMLIEAYFEEEEEGEEEEEEPEPLIDHDIIRELGEEGEEPF